MEIHKSAVVEDGASLGDVEIGPHCVIHSDVEIGDGTVIENGVTVYPYTTIGENCRFFPSSSIGSIPQDLKFEGEKTVLEIGNDNIFREFCTVNRGTKEGGGKTEIGNDNYFMAYSHIAHDCIIGESTLFSNAATLAGHVNVMDHAIIGAFSGVHQFCRVGRYAFIGGYSVITQDALPFIKSVGNRAETYGVNSIGLKREGFSEEAVSSLKRAYKLLCKKNLNTSQAVEKMKEQEDTSEVEELIDFIESSERGIVK